MKEEIYRWVKTIAFFYIVFSAVLHLVPDVKYERYIRSFMGILLIYILSTPVFNLFGNGEKLLQEFRLNYQEELTALEEKNTENLQALYLQENYSRELQKEISKKCIAAGTVMPVLMEVNVGEEISKSGIAPSEAESAFEQMLSLGGIKVMGLMSIPPACGNPDDARRYFSTIYKLFVDIKDKNRDNKDIMYLSMGMSGDYYEAISEGANIVRIGSALFGKRIYKK